MQTNTLLDPYKTKFDDESCYYAGLPGYPRNFSRDTLLAGIIATDKDLLDSQIEMSANYQGKKDDYITGEEAGKIHHEMPGVVFTEPYLTTYNACDTTALYLIGLEFQAYLYEELPERYDKLKYKASIDSALHYLNWHIVDDIFWEFPPAGAEHFSLRTTYWKDSIQASADGKERPDYPVTYALVQFQVARGLLAASRLLDRQDLSVKADRMFRKGIEMFITEQEFTLQKDRSGKLVQPSSDELHCLAYIPEKYRDILPLGAITRRVKPLITPIGIACTTRDISDHLTDKYHGYVVWIFEQALINYGCHKFGLTELAEVTQLCKEYIDEGNELLSVTPTVKSIGNHHQLWSVAAKIYFSHSYSLKQTDWL